MNRQSDHCEGLEQWKRKTKNTLTWKIPALLFGLAMLGLTCWMAVQSFSAIPFSDMWEGTLGFYINLPNRGWEAFWAQHNEHRIVLARVIFFIDYYFFNGSNLFPIIGNYILVAWVAFVLVAFISTDESETSKFSPLGKVALFALVVGLLLNWVQRENLTWGFQSQFILAQLLPLVALYSLALSSGRADWRWFVVSLVFGILSIGAMANGVLALPFLFLGSLFLPLSTWQRIALLISGLLGIVLYLRGYHTPDLHASPLHSLLYEPARVIAHMLVYMGSPANDMIGGNLFQKGAIGAVFVCCLVFSSWLVFRSSKRDPLTVGLLVFCLYVVASAFITGLGRVNFGLAQAASGRYSTPALTAWVALGASIWRSTGCSVSGWERFIRYALNFSILSLCVLTLAGQIDWARRLTVEQTVFDRSVSGLAAVLGVMDDAQLKIVHPNPEKVLSFTDSARREGLGFTAAEPYRGMHDDLGHAWNGSSEHLDSWPTCLGHVDAIRRVFDVSGKQFLRLDGWLFDGRGGPVRDRVTLIDADGTVRGFALLGQYREDLIKAISPRAARSGFVGYLMGVDVQAGDTPVYATSGECALRLNKPQS